MAWAALPTIGAVRAASACRAIHAKRRRQQRQGDEENVMTYTKKSGAPLPDHLLRSAERLARLEKRMRGMTATAIAAE